MRNLFSSAVIAAAIALAVPNNGAEAVGTMTGMIAQVAVVQPLAFAAPVSVTEQATSNVSSAQPGPGNPDPTIAWLMALGFLGVVISRRVRGQ